MDIVNRVNEASAVRTVGGWYAGLGYYGWWSTSAPHVPWWADLLLGTVGMMIACIIIGGGLASLAGLVTLAATGKAESSTLAFATAGYVSPIVAFIVSGYALAWFASPF